MYNFVYKRKLPTDNGEINDATFNCEGLCRSNNYINSYLYIIAHVIFNDTGIMTF